MKLKPPGYVSNFLREFLERAQRLYPDQSSTSQIDRTEESGIYGEFFQ